MHYWSNDNEVQIRHEDRLRNLSRYWGRPMTRKGRRAALIVYCSLLAIGLFILYRFL